VDQERAGRQLHLISDVLAIASKNAVEVWLRGGWAMDFFLGQVTRDHVDIDWFAWVKDASVITAALLESGYQAVPGAPPEVGLDVAKDGADLGFAWLARDGAGQVVVAGGPYAGERWPEGMLTWEPGQIGPLRCPIISPLAQIEIKEMMPVWVPSFPRRPKDAKDVARLRAALSERPEHPV
jgi:Aminoglycoside-2''-adenylyltransferase